MFGDANATGAFSKVQGLLLAVIGLAIAITAGFSLFGLPTGVLGLVFIVVFVGLLVLTLPRFKQTQPPIDQER